MNKDETKINKNEINNFFVNYLFDKHKEKSKKEKIKYYIILKEVNKYFEIKKIKLNIDEIFIDDKEEEEKKLELLNEEELKILFESLNNINFYSEIYDDLKKIKKDNKK